MIFVDAIAISSKFDQDIKQLAGTRWIGYREAGDIGRDGVPVEAQEVISENIKMAWIQGSHESRLQLKSDGRMLTLSGNPGRFGRADNLFNLGLDDTIKACNRIVAEQGFPLNAFKAGYKLPFLQSQFDALDPRDKERGKLPEQRWSGSRVWSIHLTENRVTGSPENARAMINWLNTQSVARVKKARLGATTVVWGSIKYCQMEVYVKADEMLAHCKTKEEKAAMIQSDAYQYALANGIIRIEVKCAKDFLRERHLTYLGNWDMDKIVSIFRERTEVIDRAKLETDDNDWLEALPKKSRVIALAWMQGIDVTEHMSRATYFRHAKVLRQAGIDISEKRNVTVLQPKLKEIKLEPALPPSWYRLSA